MRVAKLGDLRDIGMAYEEMLVRLQGQNYFLQPTQETVAFFVDHIVVPAIEREEGPYIHEDTNSQPDGMLFWVKEHWPVTQNYARMIGYGHWIRTDKMIAIREKKPEINVMDDMIEYASRDARDRIGARQVIDTVWNGDEKQLESAKKRGFERSHSIVVLDL